MIDSLITWLEFKNQENIVNFDFLTFEYQRIVVNFESHTKHSILIQISIWKIW